MNPVFIHLYCDLPVFPKEGFVRVRLLVKKGHGSTRPRVRDRLRVCVRKRGIGTGETYGSNLCAEKVSVFSLVFRG